MLLCFAAGPIAAARAADAPKRGTDGGCAEAAARQTYGKIAMGFGDGTIEGMGIHLLAVATR